MVTLSANKKGQNGLSVIEMLVASMLGILAIIMAISSLVMIQRVTAGELKQMYLRQSLSDVLRYIGDDIRRAGFNRDKGETLQLFGSNSVFALSDKGLSFVYRDQNKYIHSSVVRDTQSKKLKLCTSTLTTLPVLDSCPRYFSFLDESRIELTDFTVSVQPLGEKHNSALLSISLSAKLVNSDLSESLMIKIKQRNWQ